MMDPAQRSSLGAFQLAKSFLQGPQDLAIADGANESARRMWTAMGGAPALLYSMHWARPLRPASSAIAMLQRSRGLWPLSALARPMAKAADAVAAGLRPSLFSRRDATHSDEDIRPADMLAHLPQVMRGKAVQPVYDEHTIEWLLEQAALKRRHGTLRARSVSDSGGKLAGWYLYYCRRGSRAEVLQLAAINGKYGKVVDHLLADAWEQGAVSLHGRMDPQFSQALGDRHCWARRDGPWTLIHSKDKEITTALQTGDAFFSRLDAEWWMRFVDG